ncbi:MAG TPA: hypothetical protein VFK54_00115 [Candidatus Limnocylindrales bacterium]|nr:hypothetical protein [Candidatus Limnocylindrales bacterium]
MAAGDSSLKRLGGGRWASRDGRFRIEFESGRWVVVDEEQTDELGLPRVHGPYPSLGDARTELERLATSAPEPSPLAERIATVRARPAANRAAADDARGPRRAARRATRRRPRSDEEPEPWLGDVPPAARERARRLRDGLARLGVEDPEPLVIADLTGPRPVVAETLLRRRIAAVVAEARAGGTRAAEADAEVMVDRLLAVLTDEAADGLPGWVLAERGEAGRELRPGAADRGRRGPVSRRL